MRDLNPYQPPKNKSRCGLANAKPVSKGRWALIGFFLGAALPVVFGVYGAYQFHRYVATLPPDTPVCGNPVLGAYAMILVVGPVFGSIGAALGWFAALLVGGAIESSN